MPIYEYLCEGCGRISEVMQKITDPAPRTCPECGSKKIAKLVSRTAFQLKGGGWYSDLYASAKKDVKKDAGGGAPAGGDGTPAGTTKAPAEGKPASAEKVAPPKPASTKKASGGD